MAAPDGSFVMALTVGIPDKAGPTVSTTVTMKLPSATRPPESTTVQLTVAVPSAKNEPLAGQQVGAGSGSSSASVAVAAYRTVAPPRASPSTVTSAGTTRTGAALRRTVTPKVAAARLPPASVEVDV